MADIEPPSFSLGLDLDTQSEHRTSTHRNSTFNPASNSSSDALLDGQNDGLQVKDSDKEEEEFGHHVMELDPEPGPGPGPSRIFKRLRRGPRTETPKVRKVELEGSCFDDEDDDIEEFSSQEDFVVGDANPSTQFNSVSSSAKIPLKGCGVLTSQSSSLPKGKKKERASDAPASSSLETGSSGLMFPKLTISPLRRFQLIDSDSDEPSISEDANGKTDPSSKKQQSIASEHKNKTPLEKHQNEDLWKDSDPIKSTPVRTPVLDAMCNEYFQSLHDKNTAQKLQSNLCTSDGRRFHQDSSSAVDFQQCWNLADPLPPAHHYFFHEDPRIQRLVCSGLPNFSPLGSVNNRGNQLRTESAISYMSQFNQKQGTQRTNVEKGSARGRNKSKKSNTQEASHASEGWVDPKISTAIPKDAGKRRVQASDQGSGHWYTSPEGRKVYVSKNGEEFSGQIAYRLYKRDNGGLRRSKKKASTKGKASLQSQMRTNGKRKRG